MRKLRAVYRFHAFGEPDPASSVWRLLRRTLRLLRIHDPKATLRISEDSEPLAYDQDGD